MASRIAILSPEDGQPAVDICSSLKAMGIAAVVTVSENQLATRIAAGDADVAILAGDGEKALECVRIARQLWEAAPRCPMALITDSLSLDLALRAMRAGICDIVEAAEGPAALVAVIRRLCGEPRPSPIPRDRQKPLVDSDRMIGHGAAVSGVLDQIRRLAKSEANVLITGESGTGKELAAELIHRNSKRSSMPFVALNCAAVPETLLESELFGFERGAFTGAASAHKGKLEHASDGTLFLDEIGEMSLAAQAKMLRAIEQRVIQRLGSNIDKPARARLIAATNQNLDQLTRQGRFRQDLYFRLNVIRVHLPPLRDRREDIPELAEHILKELGKQQNEPTHFLEQGVIRRLQMHDWPGNIRELRNVIESAVVLSATRNIGLSDLPVYFRQQGRATPAGPENERAEIVRALNSADWNRGKAAQILHCSRMTLHRKMTKYAIASGE